MKIRSVTLVRRDNTSTSTLGVFSHPGLALPIIGTVLQQAGYNVKIYIDVTQPAPEEILQKSDVVGFTVNSSCFLETYETAKHLQETSQCKIVFGGPHVTFMADEALQYGDFVVRGEGEQTIVELFHALEDNHSSFEHIQGLSWRDKDGKTHHNPNRLLEEDLDTIPDQSLIVGHQERRRSMLSRLFATKMLVSTSRGCPHTCSFCTIPQIYGNTLRFRSHDAVIADMKQQIALSGRRYIYFTDDNFAINPRATKALLKRIITERLNIRFSAQVRCEITLDKELMELMQAAGANLVFVGFESINDASLKFYQKGGRQTRRQIEHSIIEFHNYKIKILGMFIIGADTDEPGIATSTAKWAVEHDVDSLQLLPVCPLPGTDILSQLEQENRVFKSYHPGLDLHHIPYGVGSGVIYQPKNMSPTELQEEIIAAYKIFYNYKNAMRNASTLLEKGIKPVGYQLLGCTLLRKARPEIRKHIKWLHTAKTRVEDNTVLSSPSGKHQNEIS